MNRPWDAAVNHWLRSRRLFFFLNLLLVALLIWLVVPLFDHQSVNATVLGRYSVGYAAYLATASALPAAYLLTAIAGGRTTNCVLFLATVTVVAGVEMVARWRGWSGYYTGYADPLRYPAPFVHFTGEPNATFDGPPRMGGTEEERRITLNALGLRGDVPAMPKNEYRVLVLGGSTVFNGAPLTKSIPGYLQEFLQQIRPGARVYNWGVTSFNTGQELTLLARLGSRYEPDLVISYGGLNDITVPYVYDPRPGYPYDWLVNETGLRMVRGGATPDTWLASFVLRSRLATVLFRDALVKRLTNLDSLRAAVRFDTGQWRQQIAADYLTNVKAMCLVSHGLGAEFAAFVQPSVFTKDPLVGGEPIMRADAPLARHVMELYTAVRAEVGRIANAEHRCTLHDVSEALDGVNEQLFWDFVHVTNEGNRRISQRVYEELVSSSHFSAAQIDHD